MLAIIKQSCRIRESKITIVDLEKKNLQVAVITDLVLHQSSHKMRRTEMKVISRITRQSEAVTYAVGQVGCKRGSTAVSRLCAKLWNCCQLWAMSFLPNKQSNLEKQNMHEDKFKG